MARDNAPAAPPAEKPPVSNDNGAGEAAGLAAAAEGLAEDGAFSGSQDEAAASLERARRQADPDAYKAEIRERADLVTVRVTEEGGGKISRGVHHGGVGEDHYEEGETFQAERRNALELKKRHYVEIAR